MARKRYTAEQIIGHLRQAEIPISEGKTVAEVVRELGGSSELRPEESDQAGEDQRGRVCHRNDQETAYDERTRAPSHPRTHAKPDRRQR